MSRFVEIGANLINVDHIVRAITQKNGTLHIILDNGDTVKADSGLTQILNDIAGRDFITSAVPCEGVYASYEYGGKEFRYPIHQFGVTACGEIRPLSLHFFVTEFHDKRPGFRGMTDSPLSPKPAAESLKSFSCRTPEKTFDFDDN